MSQENVCLGAILLLLLAIIVYFAFTQRRRGRRWGFLSRGQVVYDAVAPAPPSARKAAANLYAKLDGVVELGERYVAVADSLAAAGAKPDVPASETAPASPATWMLGARQSVSSVAASLRRANGALRAAPPTWAGYWAVYKGLDASDDSLLCAARTYEAAGHQIHQQLAAAELGLPAADGGYVAATLADGSPFMYPAADSGIAEAGALLIALGAQLRDSVRAIHGLGATLDLE